MICFSLFSLSSLGLGVYDPLPLLPYGVNGNIDPDAELYGDSMLFFYQKDGYIYEVPRVTWSLRIDNDIVYYDFVFTGWLKINGSYDDLTIALGLPKSCVGHTYVDTQYSPQGLVANFSYDVGMFALANQDPALLSPLYYFISVARDGSYSSVNPELPQGDFWYSLFYFTVSGVSQSTDDLLLTLRIGDIDDDPNAEYEGDLVVIGSPSIRDFFSTMGDTISFFSGIFNNPILARVMIVVSSAIVLGIVLKLVL